eukprot:gene29650-38775_t
MLSLSLLEGPGWGQKEDSQFLASMNNFLSELTMYIDSQKMESQHVQSHAMQQINLNILSRSDNRIGEYLNKYIVTIYDKCCKDEPNFFAKVGVYFQWTRLFRQQYLSALKSIIKNKVLSICSSEEAADFSANIYESTLSEWLKKTLLPFVCTIFDARSASFLQLQSELSISLANNFTKTRSRKLFEMVAEFPDSLPSLRELKQTATITNNMGYLGKVFRATVQRRLLHMGASTSQILDFYVAMIKALRVLDPSDLLLNHVAGPVRRYLKQRKDAVRSIVSSLTQGVDSELYGELKKGGSLEYGVDEDDEEGGPGEHWTPRRRDHELQQPGTDSAAGLDILALLVSIYGSSDLFIVEYRSLLAEKLLANLKYLTDQEVANLELLKIRFGEESLHSCEVMLKDIEDSKRINNAIQSKAASGPNSIDEYAVLKKPRKIHPAAQLGQVEVDINFDDGSVRSFMVTPLQATIAYHAAELQSVSVSRLATLCELEEDDILQGVSYWVNKGVLMEAVGGEGQGGSRVFVVCEEQAALAAGDQFTDRDDAEADMIMRSTAAADAQQRALQTLMEGYVKGLLSSNGTMTLDRLYTMLKLLVAGGSSGISNSGDARFDMNPAQLRQFLQALVDRSVIDLVDGLYMPCKK